MFRQRFKLVVQAMLCTIAGLLLISGLFSTVHTVRTAWGAPLFQPNQPTTVPPLLNYQGILRDPEGKPLSGAFKMTFRLYHDVTAPTTAAVWSETHEAVTVRAGAFNALLGDDTPLAAALFSTPDVFIGVQVDPYDEMTPRQRFAAVPFAAHADFANGLLAPGGQGPDALSVGAAGQLLATQPLSMTVANRTLVLRPTGLESNGAFTINAASGQNVGIGTNNPQAKFQVNGDKLLLQNGGRTVDMTAGGDWGSVQSNGHLGLQGGNYVQINSGANGGNGDLLINPTNPAKRVAIGQYNPAATLDVNGSTNVRGPLTVNQTPLVAIARYRNVGNDANFSVFLSAQEYNCVAAGWSAAWAGRTDPGVNMIWTYVNEDGNWWVRATFHSGSDNENPDVDVLCFRTEISSFEGDKFLNEPN